MSARVKRTAYRLIALVAILIVSLLVVSFTNSPQLQVLGIGLATSVIFALEQYVKNSDTVTAAPSVLAVDAALEGRSAVVPRPSIAVEPAPPVHTLDTL